MAIAKELRPGMIPLWMLNDASTVSEKIKYLQACRAGGITALVMHCRAGNLITYASTEWFLMIRDIVEEGARLGMSMWLYDEDPFPSGAAGGMVMAERPDLYQTSLGYNQKPEHLRPGQLWFIGKRRVQWAGLVPVERPLPVKELTDHVGTVRADWFMGRWDSRYYYFDTPRFPCARGGAVRQQFTLRVPHIPKGYKLIALTVEQPDEDGSWGGLPDLLNPETFSVFCRLSLDRYDEYVGRHFGKTIPGVFTDEAKPHGWTPITRDILPSFKAKYGYDLRCRLYQLFDQPLSDECVKTRVDYRRWVFERFMEAFVRPYRRWCDERNLYLAGHFSPEDDPLLEVGSLGSVMPIMKAMTMPGVDVIVPYTGNSSAPTLNLGSLRIGSLKSQTGSRYASSETLAACDWDVTSEKCRQILAWQKALGVDRFFTHGFFNSCEGVVNYEAPPEYGPNSSIFNGICAVNEWLKKTDMLMDGSREVADVGIVNSMVTYWIWAHNSENNEIRKLRLDLWQLILACLRAHVGVHMVDESDLQTAKIDKKGIKVGRRTYRYILVPACELIPDAVVRKLSAAVKDGITIWWFGGGPKKVIDRSYRLRKVADIQGNVLSAASPDDQWCREHLPAQALLEGKGIEDCYVRRFVARDGNEYLFGVNVVDKDIRVSLLAEGRKMWMPWDVDGDTVVQTDKTTWRLPAQCCGFFRLEQARDMEVYFRRPSRRQTGKYRQFKRLEPNILRLNWPIVIRPGKKAFAIDHPRPYWQLFNDFSARITYRYYAGDLPLESTVSEKDLCYRFSFHVEDTIDTPKLVIDPRCARGAFRVFLNNRPLTKELHWPLENITPARISLKGLRRRTNVLEFRFQIKDALEGLLTQVYIEGDFYVDVKGRKPVLRRLAHAPRAKGWQEAGLPYYMGKGMYRWNESFSGDDLSNCWSIEFDSIVDSANLVVNGLNLGTRAWAPWRWSLPNLKKGANTFELVVSSTAGNKHKLDWPNQPQGWIGNAYLDRILTGPKRPLFRDSCSNLTAIL